MAKQTGVNPIPCNTIFSPNKEIGKKKPHKDGENAIITFTIVSIYINMHCKKRGKLHRLGMVRAPEKKMHIKNHRH